MVLLYYWPPIDSELSGASRVLGKATVQRSLLCSELLGKLSSLLPGQPTVLVDIHLGYVPIQSCTFQLGAASLINCFNYAKASLISSK